MLTFQEYEEKYFVNVGSAVFTGFGILDYCYHKLFEPMESTVKCVECGCWDMCLDYGGHCVATNERRLLA